MSRSFAFRASLFLALCVLTACSHDATSPVSAPTAAQISIGVGVQGTTTTVFVIGTNFLSGGTSVAVSGNGVSAGNVVVVNASMLSVDLTVAPTADLGAHSLTVTTRGGTSAAVVFTVKPPLPTLGSIAPSAGQQGATTTATFTGSNFVPNATSVTLAGSDITVQNVHATSATSLTADLVVSSTAALGAHALGVTTDGGTTATQTFAVLLPSPALTSLSATSGLTGTTVNETLTGVNFLPGLSVSVSGTGVALSNVTFVSSTTITAQFVIDGNASLGPRQIAVTTAGGTTTPATFTVGQAPPVLGAMLPTAVLQGSTVTATISGTNFTNATTLAVSGTGVAASQLVIVNSTTLTVVLATDTAAALGPRTVTVTTLGGASTALTLTVLPPLATLGGITPAITPAGTAIPVTLTGTNFTAGATLTVSGSGVTASNVSVASSTTLTATLTASPSAIPGLYNVAVSTSSGTSNTLPFTVQTGLPTLAIVSPNIGAQTGAQTITLAGTNFAAGATTVAVAGTGVAVSSVNVVSATSLTATFTVSAGATTGGRNVTVTTASGTSAAQTFTVAAAPAINAFAASATHLLAAQPTHLTWTTSNAVTCSIDNGVGSVGCSTSLFVTPGTTKTYTLSATSAGATVTANVTTFANEPGRFAYSTSSGGATSTHIHQFSIDATTGDLTAIGSGTVAAGTTTEGIAVDPAGKFVYAANEGSDNVSMYSIDATTGALTSLGTVPAGNEPREVAVDPSGRFVYVINANTGGSGSISRYTIDGTGHLVANGTNTLGTSPRGITIDGTGRFLYATNRDDRTVQEFSINTDGTLLSLGTISTGGATTRPYYVAADPTGRFVYLTNDTQGNYSQYAINADGTLTLLGGGPVNIGPGTEEAIATDPTGRFTYIADFNNAIFHEFSINQTTGILTRFAAPTLPHTLPTTQTTMTFAIDPQGKFAYATDSNNGQIILFTIDANGVLAPVTAPLRTIGGGTSPYGVVVSR